MQKLNKIIYVITLLLLTLTAGSSYPIGYQDNEIKAAFLYRLLYFVEWPDEAAKTNNICVIGDNPFKQIKDEINSKKFDGKPVRLIETSSASLSHDKCKILFVSESESSNFRKFISSPPESTLIVSDIAKFARNGGMIGLASFNNTIKLEINTKALSKYKFKIDPNLLEVALNVY